MIKSWRIFFLALGLSVSSLAFAQTEESLPAADPAPATLPPPGPSQQFVVPEIKNLKEIAAELKVSKFKGKKFARKIKVAVLDNGWSGYKDAIGKSLPAGTQYHNGKESAADQNEAVNFHGVIMAKILAGVIKESGAEADYDLHLFNSYGYTKLADAVETVVNEKFDVVLYSQVWEFGGNGDGKGYVNALVNKATAAGVIWINAAGNFGKTTRRTAIDSKMEGADEWVIFKDKKGKSESFTKFECKAKKDEQCTLKIVMAWNDFKDDSEAGTDKDLDLFLLNGKQETIVTSERKQRLQKDLEDKSVTLLPRELIETSVPAGTYFVKAKVKSTNFAAATDELRLTFFGNDISISNPDEAETILAPADNVSVLVVGAIDDLASSGSKALKKPDLKIRSLVKLDNSSNPFGSSNAASMIAAVTVLELGTGTEKTLAAVTAKLTPLSKKDEASAGVGQVAQRPAPQPQRQRAAAPPRGYYETTGAPQPRFAPSPRERRSSDVLQTPEDFDGYEEDEDDGVYYAPPRRPVNPGPGRYAPLQPPPTCVQPIPPTYLFASAQRLVRMGAVLVNAGGRMVILAPPALVEQMTNSRGPLRRPLYIFPDDLRFATDEDYVFGELARGIEIRVLVQPVCGRSLN